jgi:hypothetical protein
MKPVLHLTEDQIDDALIGDLAAECAEHLAACEACRLRLIQAEAPLASFNDVSLAWSERRSATLPCPSPTAFSAGHARSLWATAAAAVIAFGVLVSAWHRPAGSDAVSQRQVPPALVASTGPVQDSVVDPARAREEQIARDNQLLEAIDRELADPPPGLAADYQPQAAARSHRSHPVSAAVNN